MNPNTIHSIHNFYKKYSNRTFDQDDVALFISSVRDYSKPKSTLREIGDFLAHPECKDRGISITNFTAILDFFEKNTLETFNNLDIKAPSYSSIGNADEIACDLIFIFKLADINLLINDKNNLALRDFMFCIIFLLNGYKLQFDNRLFPLSVSYGHSLELFVEYESSKHKNHFAKLTVLFLGNIWKTNSSGFTQKLPNHIARRFKNGILIAISHKNDRDINSKEVADYKKEHLWPLPDYT